MPLPAKGREHNLQKAFLQRPARRTTPLPPTKPLSKMPSQPAKLSMLPAKGNGWFQAGLVRNCEKPASSLQ